MPDFNIGFVLFPKVTQLDFAGPFEVLSRIGMPASASAPSVFPHPATHVVAKTMQPVVSDTGLGIVPTCTFDDCPVLDLLCVPGGTGIADAIADAATVEFVRRQGGQAKFITSGGVTAGIDFAFRIVAELAGAEVAQAIQLALEYDPSPPFHAGRPDEAPAGATALIVQRNAAARAKIQQGLEQSAALAKA